MIAREDRKVYRWGVLLLVVGMPWHEIVVRLWPAMRFWDELIVLAIAGCLAVEAVRSRRLPVPRLLVPMGAFLGVALLSGWLNALPAAQIAVGVRALFPYMVAGLAAAHLAGDDVRKVLRVLVVCGAFAAAYGIASYLAFRTWDRCYFVPKVPRSFVEGVLMYPYQCGAYPRGWRLAGSFLNDNFLGDWLAMLVPIAFFLGARATERKVRLAYLFAAVVMTVALAWTFSRAAYLGFAVALAVYAWRSDRRVLLLGPVLVLAAALVAQYGDLYRFKYLRKTEGGRVAAVRKATVQARNPLIGRGPGTTGVMDMHYARIAGQMGLVGLCTFGWVLAASVGARRRTRRGMPESHALRTAVLTASLPMLVGALGGDVWEIPQLAYTFWILAGLTQTVTSSEAEAKISRLSDSGETTRSVAAGGTAAAAEAGDSTPAAGDC